MQESDPSSQRAESGAEALPAVGSQAFFAHRAVDAPANLSPDERDARRRKSFSLEGMRAEVQARPFRSMLAAAVLGLLFGGAFL